MQLGRCHDCQVPWAKLGQEPVVAEFDRLYVVACPRQDDSSEQACPDPADGSDDHAAATERRAKEQRISKAEDTWLKVSSSHLAFQYRPN